GGPTRRVSAAPSRPWPIGQRRRPPVPYVIRLPSPGGNRADPLKSRGRWAASRAAGRSQIRTASTPGGGEVPSSGVEGHADVARGPVLGNRLRRPMRVEQAIDVAAGDFPDGNHRGVGKGQVGAVGAEA